MNLQNILTCWISYSNKCAMKGHDMKVFPHRILHHFFGFYNQMHLIMTVTHWRQERTGKKIVGRRWEGKAKCVCKCVCVRDQNNTPWSILGSGSRSWGDSNFLTTQITNTGLLKMKWETYICLPRYEFQLKVTCKHNLFEMQTE